MARWMMTMLAALVLGTGSAMAAPQAGNEYRVLDQPQPVETEGGVQVREFFSYGCPHCNDFHPLLADWQERMGDRIALEHVPVSFGRDSWELLAKAFYVAQVLGVLDTTHDAVFKAIHEDGRRFSSPEDIADFYGELGVDRDKALDAFDSFAVTMKMRRAERLAREYRIQGTPTLTVAGQYVIDVRAAGGQAGMLDVASYLVERERSGD
ncbi:thiol:disulfide interchange protein DsbA/DsbL [Arhodomonas aquaeolei]|uniref:thiol:disulfide interchange protein DsbA/DsbL n=1 Tax=Arhodomonas aquaeolei TaxID=2369 RepID=UPI002166D70F|nr:thiol:disulfide interchange protein DsbA/DsbL [Arhodomonas aquaeolei]MCS4504226.1 thiol:disulfide interchange protein DsbA/DsbL [Arhodomonas aquaeolei]